MTTTTKSSTVVCGVPIDDLTLEQTVDRVDELIERGRLTGRTHQVVTVNVDFVVNALSDPELLRVLRRAELAVADGMPVVWGAKLLGSPVQERVAGADLVPALAARAAVAGHSLYLFGAADGIAARAADLLAARHPGLDVVGEAGPFFDDPTDMDPSVLDRIRAKRPDILCVALGHPKQEKWIDRYRAQLGVPVLIGVGGSIDFLVGHKRRAPLWMQHTGIEWVHRIAQEPGRLLRRYVRDILRFGPALARDLTASQHRSARDHPPDDQPNAFERHGATTVMRVRGRLTLTPSVLSWTEEEWNRPQAGQLFIIDLERQDSLDHQECGELAAFARRMRQAGSEVQLVSVSQALAKTLIRRRLYGLVPISSEPAHRGTSTTDDAAHGKQSQLRQPHATREATYA